MDEIVRMFDKTSEKIYGIAKKRGLFDKKLNLAIELHDWMYYGDIDDEMVLGTQPKNGTCYAYKFATICIVEKGMRFTLKALPISDYSEIPQVVEELVKYAMTKVRISKVFLDRGFYSVPIVRVFKRLGVHFMIQAKKGQAIKKMIKRNEDKEVIVRRYKMMRKKIK